MLSSRSVAVIVNCSPWPQPADSKEWGWWSCARRTTWVVESSFNSADFVTLNSHRLMFLACHSGAVILQCTLDQARDEAFRCSILPLPYFNSLFMPLIKPTLRLALWK